MCSQGEGQEKEPDPVIFSKVGSGFFSNVRSGSGNSRMSDPDPVIRECRFPDPGFLTLLLMGGFLPLSLMGGGGWGPGVEYVHTLFLFVKTIYNVLRILL